MTNFYRIEKEVHIDEIMEKYNNKLFVLIFSVDSKNFNPEIINNTNLIKKNIKKELLNEQNIFLYINLQRYIITQNKYANQITRDSIPYISFYYNKNQIARILNAEWNVFEETYNKIKSELDAIKEKSEILNNNASMSNGPISNEKQEKNSNDLIETDNKGEQEKQEEIINKNEQNTLKEQIKQQKKLEEIEKLKQQYLINELTKLKKAKEIEETLEST